MICWLSCEGAVVAGGVGSGGEERGAPTGIEIRFSDPAVPGYRALGWAMQQGDWGPLPPGPHCTHSIWGMRRYHCSDH